jgi:GDP-4-dehydro-6-deoxy-D-mannose reductase
MKRVLITGAFGFVGRRLADHLRSQGYAVLCSGLENEVNGDDVRACDIANPESVDELLSWATPLDGIFHLAARTFIPDAHANPAAVMDVNASGTIHLVQAMRRHTPKARLVFISTSEVYGPPTSLPVNEQHPLNPQNPYAISKAAADQFCAYASAGDGLDIIRMRPFNHSGAGQADNFVLSDFARQIAGMSPGNHGNQMKVGNLEVARDFSHVDDIVRAYELAFRLGESGHVYNACSGDALTIRTALETLIQLAGVDVELVVDPARIRPTEVMEVRGDHSTLTARTGWQPEIGLTQLLEELLDYWRIHNKNVIAS